ncbi:lasso RiPP family leader peptide-containing protein [Niveispirillum sp. SYP-B3756]|nr:lasso RiPP family leader peptide-containing protein [Niveispirillum sp. SYP-B3756]
MQITPKEDDNSVKLVKRQKYVPPRLVEVGQVSDLTQSNGNDDGSDSMYS